jgi:hypothetical protein
MRRRGLARLSHPFYADPHAGGAEGNDMMTWTLPAWAIPGLGIAAAMNDAMSRRRMAELEAMPKTPETIERDARLARASARTPEEWRALGINPPVPVRGTATVAEMAARNTLFLQGRG